MAATAFNCPRCHVLLKPKTPVPSGKKIKCPKCGAEFPVTVKSGAEAASPDPSRPPTPDPLPTAELLPDGGNWEVLDEDEVEGEEPGAPVQARRRKAKEDLDEDDDDPALVRRRAPRRADLEEESDEEEEESDEDWEEEDERPRRKSNRSKAGRSIVLTILIATIVTSLAAVGGIGGTVWWYLNRDRNRGTGNELPLAYVPGDSDVIMGVDFGALMTHPTILAKVQEAARKNVQGNFLEECKKETGLELQEIWDHLIIAMHNGRTAGPGGSEYVTLVAQSSRPFDQNKVRNASKGAQARRWQGKTYFTVDEQNFKLLYMPSNRIMILSNLPEGEFQNVVAGNGTQVSLPASVTGMLGSAEHKLAWLVAPVTENSKVNFTAGFANAAGPAGQQVPQDLREALGQSKAFGMWAEISGDQVRCTMALSCSGAPAAEKAVKAVQPTMAQLKSPATLIGLAMFPKTFQTVFKEFTDTLGFSTRGELAQMSFQLKTSSLEAVANDPQAQGMMAMGGGMQAGGPGRGGMPQMRGRMGGGPGGGMPGMRGRGRGPGGPSGPGI